jgi:hypothetical protein
MDESLREMTGTEYGAMEHRCGILRQRQTKYERRAARVLGGGAVLALLLRLAGML